LGFFVKAVEEMEDKMQTAQPASVQLRSFRAETTREIRPITKLAAVLLLPETETTPKQKFLPSSTPISKPKPELSKLRRKIRRLIKSLGPKFRSLQRREFRSGWRGGVVVSVVGLTNEVSQRWARPVLGRVAVFGRINHLGM